MLYYMAKFNRKILLFCSRHNYLIIYWQITYKPYYFKLNTKLGCSLQISTAMPPIAYLLSHQLMYKAPSTVCHAGWPHVLLSRFLAPLQHALQTAEARSQMQNHADLVPAEPTTLCGPRMELPGAWTLKGLQEDCFGVGEFKQRHLRTAILLKAIICFKMEWNQTEKVSESSVEQNYFAQFQLFFLCSGSSKTTRNPKGHWQ